MSIKWRKQHKELMEKFCKVRGMTCRFWRPIANRCTNTKRCKHKTLDTRAQLIGKRVETITRDGLIFNDGSILITKKNKNDDK